jgi:peroxiredoxin
MARTDYEIPRKFNRLLLVFILSVPMYMEIRFMIRSITLALTMAAVSLSCAPSFAEVEIGAQAPKFQAKGVDGKTYSLDSAKDAKLVVICFTCNDCPVARGYEDRLIEFNKQYAPKGVKLVALNCNVTENLDQMKKRAEEKGFDFPYAYDATGEAAREYGARVTPHIFVVDNQGKVVYRGAFDDNQLNPTKPYLANAVDAVLAGKTPETSSTRAFGCSIKLN